MLLGDVVRCANSTAINRCALIVAHRRKPQRHSSEFRRVCVPLGVLQPQLWVPEWVRTAHFTLVRTSAARRHVIDWCLATLREARRPGRRCKGAISAHAVFYEQTRTNLQLFYLRFYTSDEIVCALAKIPSAHSVHQAALKSLQMTYKHKEMRTNSRAFGGVWASDSLTGAK